MTVDITCETEIDMGIPYGEIIEDIVAAALDYEGCPYEAEVDVLLTDNEGIRGINLETRGINAPTDVLSFPMLELEPESDFSRAQEDVGGCFHPETGELLLGDIVISVEKVIEQAKKYGHSRERELAFLVAHSMLHLCGYDHMDDAGRERMEERQRAVLEGRGYRR